ncbi:YbaB/EbfC family nucleoid-associated protein [Amycolatopsis antarctica]|uniref:YbaB/EbfC family nucleoid-associated protein n=1 Tax=Amycolatopsis antarctica TaxID=1854586 RepID=UPI0013FD4355|nr:YbaB/EbfC family nucleoid-associated protein [Amycolatopsis antarctica]
MSAPNTEELEQLLAQYRRQYEGIQETQRSLKEISCTVTSPRRTVSVTAKHGGLISDVSFPTSAYKRMAPKELAAAITETIEKAQSEAAGEAADLLAPSMPEGVDVHKLFRGEGDLQSLMPQSPRGSSTLDELLNRGK